MIKFIYGGHGSGKTTEILNMLRQDAEKGISSILIVPEQEAVQAERFTLENMPDSAQLTLEVLNFSRLYNRVCRDYGGLCYSYITKPTKHLIMWKCLRDISPTLKEYSTNASTDPAFVSTMLSAISELKYAAITTDDLDNASKECENTHPSLSRRLYDISAIYGAYTLAVNNSYSDASDDLSKLCDILDKHNFFSDKNVYIDSFTSFTGIEHRVIEKIFASAKNTVVTIPLESKSYSDISTGSIEESVITLKKNANKWGGHSDLVLEEDKRQVHPSIAYLSKNLWNLGSTSDSSLPNCDNHVIMEICETPYSEAEAIASHILKLLSEGARCRDIVVIPRESSKYRGIIEFAFDNAGIPYYFSEKNNICSLPPVKFILTALKIYRYNWQKNDVLSHIKTGLCDFSQHDADVFEEYINTWNISGDKFRASEWTMNPDGFEKRISERGKVILATANKIRTELCSPLEEFFLLLRGADTISDMCRALYGYMEKVNLREKSLLLAQRELSYGNKKTAAELSSAYDIILSTLAEIGAVTTNMNASADDFYTILKTVFEQTDVGTIPTSIDEVIIGSASMLRSSNPKYVFIPGLCEGEYPATVDDTGIIGSNDRNVLETLDINLGNNNDLRSSDELMYVKNAFSAPTKKLFLLTSNTNARGDKRIPSLPFRRAKLILEIEPHKFSGNDLTFLSGSPRSAASHLRNIKNEGDRLAATDAVAEQLPLVSSLSTASAVCEDYSIDPATVRRILKDRIYVSPSSLERYVKCPLNYFAQYWLSLREVKYGRFGSNHLGSFVHYVMEKTVKFVIPSNGELSIPSDEEIKAEINVIVKDYISSIVTDSSYNTKRMEHIYKKLSNLSALVIDNVIREFRDCDFRPVFFEFDIGESGNTNPSFEIPLSNGAVISLRGSVDRVDIWKSNDSVYVRIVDYKSGKKTFNLDDVSNGVNIQMLLYLFAICRNPSTTFRTSTGLEDGETPIPAGVVYLSSHTTKQTLKDYSISEEEILESATERILRSGVVLDENSVINAMSHSYNSEMLMGIEQKDGRFVGKALLSSQQFEDLYEQIYQILTEIGERIYSGRAENRPMYQIKDDPCRFCTVKQLCRKNDFERRR